jgi:hypothetical protein
MLRWFAAGRDEPVKARAGASSLPISQIRAFARMRSTRPPPRAEPSAHSCRA